LIFKIKNFPRSFFTSAFPNDFFLSLEFLTLQPHIVCYIGTLAAKSLPEKYIRSNTDGSGIEPVRKFRGQGRRESIFVRTSFMDGALALAKNTSKCNLFFFLNNITVKKNIQVTCYILFYFIVRLYSYW